MTTVLQTCLPPVIIPGGLAGFPGLESFALTEVPGARPLLRLTSTDRPDVAFVVSPPGVFFPDYAPVIDDQAVERLGLTTGEDALLLVVLTVGRGLAGATANLLAPVLVNRSDGRAAQVIAEGDHSLRAPLRP